MAIHGYGLTPPVNSESHANHIRKYKKCIYTLLHYEWQKLNKILFNMISLLIKI